MIQYIAEFPCPNCQHKLRVKHEYLGKTLRCKYCAHEFPTPAATNGQAETPAEAADKSGDTLVPSHTAANVELELQSLREELSTRNAAYTIAIENFQQAQHELARLQDQLQQALVYQRDAMVLQQQLSSAQTEVDDLRAQVVSFQARAAEAEPSQVQRSANGAAVDPTSEQPESLSSGLPSAEPAVRPATGVTHGRLLEKAQSIRAQLQAGSAIKERFDRLNAELESARTEKDRLTEELQVAAKEVAQCRTKIEELQHSLAESTGAHTNLSQTFQQARTQWETEQQTLQRQWEDKHQATLREAEQRFEEEKNRAEEERRQFQEQQNAIRQTHEQECTTLRAEIEKLRQEGAALRQERDAALNQVQALGEERNRIAAERDEIDARYKEALERFRDDVYRLTQSWQQSRQQETAEAAEQSRALAEQVEDLRAELEQQRGRETEHMQTIAAIQQAMETARAEAEAERERGSNALAEQKARAEAELHEQLDSAQRRFDENNKLLKDEVQRLREEIAALQQALEIVGVVAE